MPSEPAHAQTLLRLRARAEELLEAGHDAEYLQLVGELQFDAQLWPHVWAPHAALAAHRLGDPDAFEFLAYAADRGFNQPELFDGRLQDAFGADPRFAATMARVEANVPDIPLRVLRWPDPAPSWPLRCYATTPDRELVLRTMLPERSDTAWATVRRLTAWVSQRWSQANAHIESGDAVDVLEAVRDGARFDAREYAVVLAQGLNALGIPARRTGLRRPDHHYGVGKGHIVAEAWVDDLDRWVLLDAQKGACWVDEGGIPMSAVELQTRFAAGAAAPELVRALDGAPLPDASFWFTYFSSVDTTGLGWAPPGVPARPVFQETGIICMPRLVHDARPAYPSLSQVGIGFSGERSRPLVTIHAGHPHARGFHVRDAAGQAGEVPLTEPTFVLPMTPGRHDIAIQVVTTYGPCAPNALEYEVR